MMTVRLAEKARAARRVLMRRIAWIAAALAVSTVIAWVLFFSPLFALDTSEVEIVAVDGDVEESAIRAVIESYAGVPLPRLGLAGVESGVEEIPSVFDATITRSWPDGLTVAVVARTPVALVPVEKGYEYFDAEGVQLGQSAEPIDGLPIVSTPIDEHTPATLGAILAVLGSLPEDLRTEIAEIEAGSEMTIGFRLADGALVKWGANSENELKAAVLRTLRQNPASVYDVSAPRTPVTS